MCSIIGVSAAQRARWPPSVNCDIVNCMKRSLICLLWGPLLAQNGGVVEGTVVNKGTGVGIGGATVHLTQPGGPSRYEASTDSAGMFRIAGVKSGEYRSSVEKDGYY